MRRARARMFQAEGTASTNARRNGKEAGRWGPVSKKRGGRRGVQRGAGPDHTGLWRLSAFHKGSLGSLQYPCSGWTPE